jgi:hypothetical protein
MYADNAHSTGEVSEEYGTAAKVIFLYGRIRYECVKVNITRARDPSRVETISWMRLAP